ncbi:PPC domain-containing DNA-binding protein [Olivibacter sitiensis]|uniref:PPC domain-containing DNA-binding protein n=1 Tax=Olivibacter sitiensis TaxID=376470 RepID=UPI0004167D9A|nr:PPC domain-containing DNA-binding protein [Olivibacter sitiensis]
MKKFILLALIGISINNTMKAQVLKGSNWSAKKVDSTYIVSVQDKSSILDALTDFVVTQKIQAGQITGIGAVNEATLRFFNPETKKYVDKTFQEQMEVSNLSGNISEVEGKPMLHLHITLGKSDYTALAGHLLDAKIRGAGEFFIYPLDNHVVKVKNEAVGLNFYDFDK